MNINTIIERLEQLKVTDIEYNTTLFDEPQLIRSSLVGDYVFQGVTAWVELCGGLWLLLQNGLSYKMNNYSLPSNRLVLSDGGGCSKIFLHVNELTELECEGINDETFSEYRDKWGFESKEQLLRFYLALQEAIVIIDNHCRPHLNIGDFDVVVDSYDCETLVAKD